MRRRTGLNADKARRLLLKEWQDMAALHLAVQNYLLLHVGAVDLKMSNAIAVTVSIGVPWLL
jgi:hypothetical protein